MTSPSLMHEAGLHSKPVVYWGSPEGWDGEGGGRGVQDGVRGTPMYSHGWFMSMYCKNNHSVIK